MITSKVLALSLLLVCPLALARVQLHTQAELKNSKQYGNQSADVTFQIDAQESLEIYNHGNVKVEAELLAEKEDYAVASFAIYAKNTAGEYEKISTPVLTAHYTEPAILSMGSTDGEIFTLTVEAQKI